MTGFKPPPNGPQGEAGGSTELPFPAARAGARAGRGFLGGNDAHPINNAAATTTQNPSQAKPSRLEPWAPAPNPTGESRAAESSVRAGESRDSCSRVLSSRQRRSGGAQHCSCCMAMGAQLVRCDDDETKAAGECRCSTANSGTQLRRLQLLLAHQNTAAAAKIGRCISFASKIQT